MGGFTRTFNVHDEWVCLLLVVKNGVILRALADTPAIEAREADVDAVLVVLLIYHQPISLRRFRLIFHFEWKALLT